MSATPRYIQSRRQFLLRSSAFSIAGLSSLRLDALMFEAGNAQQDDPQLGAIPRDTLLKFNPDGSPRPFAGNTVICHLPQQSRLCDAVASLGNALRSSTFAHKLGIVPSNSYHVTILGGLNDQDRARYGWPADIRIDTPIADCNRIIAERVTQFRMRSPLPLRFRVDAEKTLAPQRASGLQLMPADSSETLKLRTLRDRLAGEVFRYRAEDLETFRFHISLAYQLSSFTMKQRREYQTLLAQHVAAIVAAAPVIELGEPEFCTFENMDRFEVRALLNT